jgi:uncharacterized membrane protein SpoIIM required for sporulation/uncharacterized RDD family membrane protein YckC
MGLNPSNPQQAAGNLQPTTRNPQPAPARGDDFTQKVEVETPELVVLSYTIAGVGSRVYAGFIDLLICIGMLIGVVIATAMLQSQFGSIVSAVSAWGRAILVLAGFAIFWGYYVVSEWLFDGQTLGKRQLGLRVVRDGGYSIGFAAAATRNIMRAIDMQPGFFYLFGITAAVISRTGKRLGDMVAGTVVIQEKLVESPVTKTRGRARTADKLAVAVLSEDEFRLVERWYARRLDLDPERRATLTRQIADRLRRHLQQDADTQDSAKLARLYEAERQARDAGIAGRSETGAARERYAIVATNSPRWLAFASVVAEAQRNGLKSLGEKRVREFVAEYRSLSSDLARLRTAARDTEASELFYLSRLVGAAHNLLYRERGLTFGRIARFVALDVPREIRRSVRPIALATTLLFLPGIISAIAVIQRPSVAPVFIPASMLDRANAGVKRAADGTGYIEDPQVFRPVMASMIISNNVQVTFMAFAAGITAGFGTAFLLLMNGVSLGGVIGLYQSKGILPLLAAFVAPHGVLELSAICIAGGGGFLIAAALLIPGRRTRRRALAENGRRAIVLIAGSTMMLIAAGTLEGLVSPIPYWPLEWKLSVSAITAVLMYAWLRLGAGVKSAEWRVKSGEWRAESGRASLFTLHSPLSARSGREP